MRDDFFDRPYFQRTVSMITGISGLFFLIFSPISLIMGSIGLIMSISVRYKAGIILNSIVLGAVAVFLIGITISTIVLFIAEVFYGVRF